MQNAPREHFAILLTFIKLSFVFKTFVLSIFEWPLKTRFTVYFFLYFSYSRTLDKEDVPINCILMDFKILDNSFNLYLKKEDKPSIILVAY